MLILNKSKLFFGFCFDWQFRSTPKNQYPQLVTSETCIPPNRLIKKKVQIIYLTTVDVGPNRLLEWLDWFHYKRSASRSLSPLLVFLKILGFFFFFLAPPLFVINKCSQIARATCTYTIASKINSSYINWKDNCTKKKKKTSVTHAQFNIHGKLFSN